MFFSRRTGAVSITLINNLKRNTWQTSPGSFKSLTRQCSPPSLPLSCPETPRYPGVWPTSLSSPGMIFSVNRCQKMKTLWDFNFAMPKPADLLSSDSLLIFHWTIFAMWWLVSQHGLVRRHFSRSFIMTWKLFALLVPDWLWEDFNNPLEPEL